MVTQQDSRIRVKRVTSLAWAFYCPCCRRGEWGKTHGDAMYLAGAHLFFAHGG